MTTSFSKEYAGYRVLNWSTPISTITHGSILAVARLVVTSNRISDPSNESKNQGLKGLIIEIKKFPPIHSSEEVDTINFVFPVCIALKLVDESYYTGFDKEVNLNQLGNTLIVEDSPWINRLRETSPMFGDCGPSNPKHYMFLTNDYTIEVISESTPTVQQVTC